MVGRCLLACAALAACGGASASDAVPIRFLHTFSPAETELFNAVMAERGLAVEPRLVPFARGQQVITEILSRPAAEGACPDLVRIDATWLPALVDADLVRGVPQGLVSLDWTTEATSLAKDPAGAWHAVPQSVDGLVVVRERDMPAPTSATVESLVTAARAQRHHSASPGVPVRIHPLGVRVDGYWLVPWLRAIGVDLVPSGFDSPEASGAVVAFAGLVGDLAPPPPPAGDETPDELRRWNNREVAYWVTGPWQLGALTDREAIAVSPLARAPRGGQLLVVPTCSKRPDEGWKLARELVDAPIAKKFADAFVTVPTRTSTLALASPLVHAIADALHLAEPLPRASITPLLFDDLNPALAAVVAHDATADEAIAGVRRGWKRLATRIVK